MHDETLFFAQPRSALGETTSVRMPS